MASFRSLAGWLLLCAVPAAHARIVNTVPASYECGLALLAFYDQFAWPGPYYNATSGALARCKYPKAVVSQYAAAYTYCADKLDVTLGVLDSTCRHNIHEPMLPVSDFAANLTPAAIAEITVYTKAMGQAGSSNSTGKNLKRGQKILPNITEAILLPQSMFNMRLRTEHSTDQEDRLQMTYAFVQYGFWAIVLVFGIVQNAVRHLIDRQRGTANADDAAAEGPASGAASAGIVERATAFVRKYVQTPGILASEYRHARLLGCTVPTRAEAFVVLAYWLLSITLSGAHINAYPTNKNWSSVKAQVCRYLARRLGVLAYGNLAMLYLFAGRNNPFRWLTGWSYTTFNTFHRHIARIVLVEALIHAGTYPAYYIADGKRAKFEHKMTIFFMRAGVAAICILGLVVLVSIGPVRRRFYDSFLLSHIVGSVLLLVFLYYHTANADLVTYVYDPYLSLYNYPFLVPVFCIWGLDRLARIARQLYVNLHVRAHGTAMCNTTATVTYSEATNMLAIDAGANDSLVPRPGQHYFVYQPARFFGWENHPFTLAHWTRQAADGTDGLHMQFWVRPQHGWTRSLQKQCLAVPASPDGTHTLSTRLLLEGPYGITKPLHTFDEVMLIAGGSGITAVLPYLLDYVQRRASAAAGRVPTRTRHITLVWADPRAEHLRSVASHHLAALAARADVSLILHDTSATATATATATTSAPPAGDAALDEKAATDDEKRQADSTSGSLNKSDVHSEKAAIPLLAGRPHVHNIIHKRAHALQGTSARLAVMVSGPQTLTDAVRYDVADLMTTARDAIVYYEEAFSW